MVGWGECVGVTLIVYGTLCCSLLDGPHARSNPASVCFHAAVCCVVRFSWCIGRAVCGETCTVVGRGKRLTHLAVMPPWFGCVASIVMVVSAANTGTTVRPMPVPVQERGRLCVSIFGGNGRLPQPLKNKDQRTTASSGLDYYCVLVHGVQRAAAHAHAHTRSE